MAYFERGNWLVQFSEQWSQFFYDCNWYTFNPILIEVEDERNMGNFELRLVILGLGVRVAYQYAETEFKKDIIRRVAEISDAHQEG